MTKLDIGPFYVSEFTVPEDGGPDHVLVENNTEQAGVNDFVADAAWAIRDLEAGSYVLVILDADEWDKACDAPDQDDFQLIMQEYFQALEEFSEL